jgi:hypothetical protein
MGEGCRITAETEPQMRIRVLIANKKPVINQVCGQYVGDETSYGVDEERLMEVGATIELEKEPVTARGTETLERSIDPFSMNRRRGVSSSWPRDGCFRGSVRFALNQRDDQFGEIVATWTLDPCLIWTWQPFLHHNLAPRCGAAQFCSQKLCLSRALQIKEQALIPLAEVDIPGHLPQFPPGTERALKRIRGVGRQRFPQQGGGEIPLSQTEDNPSHLNAGKKRKLLSRPPGKAGYHRDSIKTQIMQKSENSGGKLRVEHMTAADDNLGMRPRPAETKPAPARAEEKLIERNGTRRFLFSARPIAYLIRVRSWANRHIRRPIIHR